MNGVPALAASGRPRPVVSLTWMIKSSFLVYVTESGGTIQTEGAVFDDRGFTFPVAAEGSRFTGMVRFSSHGGALSLVIADPELCQRGDTAELTVAVEGGERLPFAVLGSEDATAPGVLAARLTREGAALFDGIYPTGMELDPVHIVRAPEVTQIAIVGSGPAGCYSAQALRKLLPEARLVIFDRMPVPYGLVRYGIAADHQGTKAITKQFDRLFERDGVEFVGNAAIGEEVPWEHLRKCFDAVVVATGTPADRALDIPGGRLRGVYGSGAFSSHLNGYPGFARADFRPGPDVVVIGAGNVAIDVVRLLAKPLHSLTDSDIHPDHTVSTLADQVERITVFSRSPLAEVRCDAAMLRELGRLEGARIVVVGAPAGAEASAAARALENLGAAGGAEPPRLEITFRFDCAPTEILGEERVTAVRSRDATGVGVTPATSVISAIGFEATDPLPSGPNVFPAGWAHIGPRGALPEARQDARRAASAVAAFLADNPTLSGSPGLDAVLPLLSAPTDFHGWKNIDAAETAAAAPDRVRQKILDIDDLLAVAHSAIDRKDP